MGIPYLRSSSLNSPCNSLTATSCCVLFFELCWLSPKYSKPSLCVAKWTFPKAPSPSASTNVVLIGWISWCSRTWMSWVVLEGNSQHVHNVCYFILVWMWAIIRALPDWPVRVAWCRSFVQKEIKSTWRETINIFHRLLYNRTIIDAKGRDGRDSTR